MSIGSTDSYSYFILLRLGLKINDGLKIHDYFGSQVERNLCHVMKSLNFLKTAYNNDAQPQVLQVLLSYLFSISVLYCMPYLFALHLRYMWSKFYPLFSNSGKSRGNLCIAPKITAAVVFQTNTSYITNATCNVSHTPSDCRQNVNSHQA